MQYYLQWRITDSMYYIFYTFRIALNDRIIR